MGEAKRAPKKVPTDSNETISDCWPAVMKGVPAASVCVANNLNQYGIARMSEMVP